MKTYYVVIDPLITDEHSWETHLPSILLGYIESNNLTTCRVEEISNLEYIKTLFQKKKITSNDVFIFPNAWTSMTNYVKHWSENYRVQPEMIGFWSRGCYINLDSEFRPFRDRNWRKVYERSNFRCLDRSYFIDEYHKEQFRIYVSKRVFPERLNVIAFPLEYLNLELAPLKDIYYKQNMIIFPWNKYTTIHEQIVYDFIRVFREYKVIFAQEKSTLPRTQLLTQIAKSKVAFLPYDSPDIGKEIYECLLLNTIPLVPDIKGLETKVPEIFRYPPEWTESIMSYTHYADQLTTKIRNFIEEFEIMKPAILSQLHYSYEKFYDSEPIVRLIFGDAKRK